jgi:hypothetical protein
MKLLDEVMTNDGRATIVGFPSHTQVEVRLLDQAGLLILDKTEVTEIVSKEASQEHEEAKAQGVNMTVPEEIKEYQAQSTGTHTTQAHADPGLYTIDPPQAEPERLAPVGRDGRPLRGVALRNYLRKHSNEA